MEKYNTFKDALGEVRVASNKYWGATTQRSLENFQISDESMPKEIISALALIKKCSAKANHSFGLIDEAKLNAIEEICDDIISSSLNEHFPLKVWQTGSGTHSNMNVNEVISNVALDKYRLKVHPNDDVNKSQSSNDTFPSALKIAIYSLVKEALLPKLIEAEREFSKKEKEFMYIVKSGRTHLMDATPISLGQEFSGYRHMIVNTKKMIENNLSFLLELPLGSTAVGTGINTPDNYQEKVIELISSETGYDFKPSENNFHGLTSMDFFVNLSASLKALATNLIKISNDLRLLSSGPNTGIAEINLPANEPGSSIMPGKVNPSQLEALIMLSYQVIGYDSVISLCASSGILELNVCQPLVGYDLLKSVHLLSDGLESFNKKCLSGIEANEKNIEENLYANAMLITALNTTLGYDKCSEITKISKKNGISLRDAAISTGEISAEDFDEKINPLKICKLK